MAISLKTIFTIIAMILQLIAEGMPEAQAVSKMSAQFGVSEKLLRKFL